MGVNMKTNLELYKVFYYVAKNQNITQDDGLSPYMMLLSDKIY